MPRFPFGPAIATMLCLAALGAVMVALRANKPRESLVFWSNSDLHMRYQGNMPQYPAAALHGWTTPDGGLVDCKQVKENALNLRLLSMFMGGRSDAGVPDIVQVEIGKVGMFFRPPVSQVGFLPLDHYLDTRGEQTIANLNATGQAGWKARCESDGKIYAHDGTSWTATSAARADHWRERLVTARLAPWSKQGTVFGIPQDVHPVALAWRVDLFEEVGVDLSQAKTWPKFQEACLRFEAAWKARGVKDRRAFEAKEITAEWVRLMCLQRGFDFVDDNGPHLTDPRLAEILAFYTGLIAGPRAIGRQSTGKTAQLTQEIIRGELCAIFAPDWRITVIQANDQAGALVGKLRLRPLPIFQAGDAPTSTLGGQMLAIPRVCPRPDQAFAAIEQMCLSATSVRARLAAKIQFLPPLPEYWSQYNAPEPFLGGQEAGRLYAELAKQVPMQRMTPATALAEQAVANVLIKAKDRLIQQGPEELAAYCAQCLALEQEDLNRRIRHAMFEIQVPQ